MATFTPAVIRDRRLHNGYTVIATRVRSVGRHGEYDVTVPPMPPLLSQTEMVARIEAARLEDAPSQCPTCGSTTPEAVAPTRRCYACQAMKPLSAFPRHAGNASGVAYICRLCSQAQSRAYRREQKRAAIRKIFGRAS